jgi:hypothetical protein
MRAILGKGCDNGFGVSPFPGVEVAVYDLPGIHHPGPYKGCT